MKNRFLYFSFLLFIAGNTAFAKGFSDQSIDISARKDTLKMKTVVNGEVPKPNEYLKERLKPIQSGYKRINSIRQWTAITKKNIEGESAEGGEAAFYYKNKRLEKVIARHYGEMGRKLIEYYLLNGRLSFVFEKEYTYNRPLFYDLKAMKENSDTEAFDLNKSDIMEIRSYFEKGNLIYTVNNKDTVASFGNDHTQKKEQKISEDFQRLLKLSQEK
ncbi:hypothetical protein EGY07_14540 [Chryseobacterium indologenes]|uniref:hypothetical protein n=1 Tax=Chryseobacterium indologenes TaxID=253 RepID=UPI000F508631|nr:hypothetical protein [Chryseobacterium indologenes]AYZ36699.1 hypothetical protein EGY07_14540 [Chryseobacterium indologenes]MBF6645474.1 hypothetical protein [Chryseobacterium indologenes]MBU3049593.1 hypothetical protein [Chryseobacterium indologenes]MEB4760321.1 hypothetical protein [Chryseobacterium indologenes]QQQ70850.1 hypothetical protein JHW31_20655 [Chryseobacterium indologenes]